VQERLPSVQERLPPHLSVYPSQVVAHIHLPFDWFGTFLPTQAAFPDWTSICTGVTDNADGTTTAITQQKVGKMQGDLPAMGPFPAVILAEASDQSKYTECILPYVVALNLYS
jgi:hypothetical protein